jgi:cell division septum initiation protein DivIVA
MGPTTDFPLVEKGYDPSEVDEYLSTQMLQLREELESATARIVELENDLDAANSREDAIRLTMMAATKARDELISQAEDNAKQIVGDARRAAFVLMTESRSDADHAIAEGNVLVNGARTEALSVVNDAEEETNRLVAERQETLAKMHREYEAESAVLIDRINTLRSIADDLASKTATPTTTSEDLPSPNEGRTVDAPQATNEPDHEDQGEAPIADRIRESFSGRRSAKLPRIGEEAGRNALAAANAMRAHLTHEPDEPDSSGEEDLSVRTA